MSVFIFRNIRRQTFEKEQYCYHDLYLRKYDSHTVCANLAECSVGYCILFMFLTISFFVKNTILELQY